MKLLRTIYTLPCLFTGVLCWAQPNYVPDVVLRDRINAVIPGLVGGDGYITEPGAHLNLTLYLNWVPWDLTGLEYLNVDTFELNVSTIPEDGTFPAFSPGTTVLTISLGDTITLPPFPTGLYDLHLGTTLHQDDMIAFPDGLRKLFLGAPQFTALPELPNGLETLVMTNVHLGTVNTLPNGLRMLGIGGYSEMDLELPSNLERLSMGELLWTQLPELPASLDSLHLAYFPELEALPVLPGLTFLEWYDIPLTTMPALPSTLRYLDVLDNDNLTELPPLPEGLESLYVNYDPALRCLPWLPASLTELQTDLPCIPNQPPNVDLYPLCTLLSSFCPEPNPTIRGHVFIDEDGNGVQEGEEPDAFNVTVQVLPSGHITGTDSAGNYVIGLPIGEHTISIVDGAPSGSVMEPAAYVEDLPTMGLLLSGRDFRIVPPPPPPPPPADMAIRVYQDLPPRPGFMRRFSFRTIFTNYSGPYHYTFVMDPDEELVEVSFPVASIVGNVITSEEFFEPLNAWVTVRTPVTVPLGQTVTTTISVGTLEDDPTPQNNTRTYISTVVGSYDPNDKQAFPSLLTPDEVAGDTLVEYLIRFQNTGTYEAERVLITDTLSTDLRWNTLRFVESSHACEWFLSDGVVHFVFNDIHLPDSTSDELGSHGYVRFRIRPNTALQQGESVTNIANIYFDFNEPVITEPCVLAVELPTQVPQNTKADVSLYPVPAHVLLNVVLQDASRWTLEVVAFDGRIVQRSAVFGTKALLDVHALSAGVYMVLARSAEGVEHQQRFVKE